MAKRKARKSHDKPNEWASTKQLRAEGKELPLIPSGYYCNARNKPKTRYCELRAGWGTDHAGSGRCKLHGGSAGLPAKHGAYASGVPKRFRDLAEAIQNLDPIAALHQKVIDYEVFIRHNARLLDTGKIDYVEFQNRFNILVEQQRKVLETANRITRDGKVISEADFRFFWIRAFEELRKIIQDVSIKREDILETWRERMMAIQSIGD